MTAQMNFPFKIARHDTIEFDGRKYSFNQAAGGGHLLLTDLETGNPLQIENKATGGLMLPTVQWFLDMMRDRRIVLRREKLPSVIRQQEREKQRDAADIRALDPRADARLDVLRYMDANNVPMSDKKIDAALDILCTEEWIAKFGARPGLSTVRHWMIFRGRPGERFLRDCFSVAGRTKRARRMHPTLVSIFAYYQLDFFTNQGLNMYETFGELHALFQEVIDFKNTNEHKGLGGRQPLAVFEESARSHGIDIFPDLDKLENVIGDVFYGRVLQKSGVELWGMRFGGAEEVPELLDDLMGTEVRRTQNPTVTVKVKGNRDNIGSIKVWNPVRGRYMPLFNQTIEEAEGMPLWLHERAVAFAKAEGLAFRTVEDRVFARERMVRLAREIQPEAKAKERRTLAKLASLPIVDEIIGKSISIDRVLKNPTDVINPVPFDLAAPTRKDAEVEPVRSARVRDAADEADRDRRDAGSPNKLTNAKRDVRDAGAAKPVKAKKSKTPKPRKAAWGDFS